MSNELWLLLVDFSLGLSRLSRHVVQEGVYAGQGMNMARCRGLKEGDSLW